MVSDTMLSMILAQISTLQDRVDAHDERFVDTDVFIGNMMRLQTVVTVLEKRIESLEDDHDHINTLADSLITSKLMQLAMIKRIGRIEMHLGLTNDEDSDA